VTGAVEGERTGLRYEPALDGIRAVAVLAVVGYHLGWGFIGGGFLGVDAFFVLSGYLITRLLVAEWSLHDRISLSGFYARRALRLLPALFLVLAAVAVYWELRTPSDQLSGLRGDALASLFYVSNWRFIATGQSYFAQFATPSPLLHLWSLAIEEQFYLIWPLIVIASMKVARGSRWVLVTVCAVGIVTSGALMAALFDPVDASRAYYGTDARVHALLVGALFALVPVASALGRWFSSRWCRVLGGVAAAGVLLAILTASDDIAAYYRGGSLLYAVLVGLVIVTVVGSATAGLARLLSIAPMLWIGIRSYGIYLWHWPVIVYMTAARTGLEGLTLDAARIAVTFGAAALSYTFVERPIRMRRWARPVRRVVLPTAFVAVAGLIVVSTAGATAPPDFLAGKPGEVQTTPSSAVQPDPGAATSTTVPGAVGFTPGGEHVQLLGDSVAASIKTRLGDALGQSGIAMSATTIPGCGNVEGFVLRNSGEQVPWAVACDKAVRGAEPDLVAQAKPDAIVWLNTWDAFDRTLDGAKVRAGTPDGDRALLAALDRSVTRLAIDGRRVLFVIAPTPTTGDEPSEWPSDPGRFLGLERVMRTYAAAHPDRASVVNLAALVCPNGPPCPQEVDGVRLRPLDGWHFDDAGAHWVAQRLAPLIERCLREPENALCGEPAKSRTTRR
jgi:peptidoglycan/LPS O-acetylase OafA/YrhL